MPGTDKGVDERKKRDTKVGGGWFAERGSRFATLPLDGVKVFFIEFRQRSFGIMMMDCGVLFRR